MANTPVSPAKIAAATAAYQQALAEGCVPIGQHICTGKTSAITRAAAILKQPPCTIRRHLDRAHQQGLRDQPPADKPRVRVAAGSAPVEPPPKPTATDRWLRQAPVQPAHLGGPQHVFYTEADGSFTFGACGDQHAGSKYERRDVWEALYDAYAAARCRAVFNTGNWVDGEARFNVHDLHTRGMDAQLRYLARAYPRRDGLTTYAVTGDDHEGWYAQREGVDVGHYAQRCFEDAGRRDWVDLGYMEAPVLLRHPVTGAQAVISVVHPGGGSSYALSYGIQKIIESLDGGEKPAIGLYGHYHKLWSGNIRNVWCVQTGTGQDQTPFMRKKKLEAHVGGYLCRAQMDPETGAIVRFSADCLRFFHRGYYVNRWSHHGAITQPDLVPPGIAS